jgi:hypothetical protein
MTALPPSMTLCDGIPRMSPEARERVEAHLSAGCLRCRSASATLTRRINAAGGVHAALQCDGCGFALSNAMPRAQHYEFQQYATFDETKKDAFYETQAVDRLQSKEAFKAQVVFKVEERSDDYGGHFVRR